MRFSFALVALAVSCSQGQAPAPDAGPLDAGASAAPSASQAPSAKPSSDVIEPVYPRENAPLDPLAVKFCEAVQGAIPTRRNACCSTNKTPKGTEDPGVLVTTFAGECARTLSYAIRHESVTLDADAVDKCVAATDILLAGCDWVGPAPPHLPEVCTNLIKGKRAENEVCRSSLECNEGLYCFGLGAIKAGRCGPPLAKGKACGPSTDSLASFTIHSRLVGHPLCEGYCNARKCDDAVAEGAECSRSAQCGAGSACKSGRCAKGAAPAAGEKCEQNECSGGARCVMGNCVVPKKAGEACASDAECRGACEIAAGATEGKCAQRCPGPPKTNNPIDLKPKAPPKKK
jgi:hypothetical protein